MDNRREKSSSRRKITSTKAINTIMKSLDKIEDAIYTIVATVAFLVVLIVIGAIIRDYYQLYAYPRYTILYTKSKSKYSYRWVEYYYYVNNKKYAGNIKDKQANTRYYIKFSYVNPDIISFYETVPDIIQNPPDEGWEHKPTYTYGGKIYDYKGNYLADEKRTYQY